jgi:hypothetical protein
VPIVECGLFLKPDLRTVERGHVIRCRGGARGARDAAIFEGQVAGVSIKGGSIRSRSRRTTPELDSLRRWRFTIENRCDALVERIG